MILKNQILKMETYRNIIKFNDFDDLEYRKGSKEYGGILLKLMDFLRLYDKGDMVFSISRFEELSNITEEEIRKLISAKNNGNNLYSFNIEIKDGNISFMDFKNGKSRPFESNLNIKYYE